MYDFLSEFCSHLRFNDAGEYGGGYLTFDNDYYNERLKDTTERCKYKFMNGIDLT
jgi:hypothetical protein